MTCGMAEEAPKTTREERLAAQLRANLRRRKEQARALRDGDGALPGPSQDGLA